jgi:hypothetical protein
MDGVAGLNQLHIGPAETHAYEITFCQQGTHMSDEMVEIAMGMMVKTVGEPGRWRMRRLAVARVYDRLAPLYDWLEAPMEALGGRGGVPSRGRLLGPPRHVVS